MHVLPGHCSPRRLLLVAAALLVAVAAAAAPPARAASRLPAVGHVFVVNLENEGFDATFGPGSPATYLNGTLRPAGELLTQYYAIGHASLDNYVAEISGQAPDTDTQGDCPVFADFVGTGTVAPQQAVGQGCVYPPQVQTVADQLTASGRTWKGYMEDMGNDPSRESATCGHPPLNGQDDTQQAEVGDQYAARHNPFVYFHSLLDSGACAANDVPLSQLTTDLASAATTRNLSFITPNLCDDGHDSPCVDGRPGGLQSADAWLQTWVPKILASPAYQADGLLVITFDEAGSSDTTACCGEVPGPNSPAPGITGPGGGRVGALVLSPYVQPGSQNTNPYNHYALLCSVEDLFGLPHLGFAGQPGLRCFGGDVYNAA